MTQEGKLVFNPPPGWPKPPKGWHPPPGWTPDPSWPTPPNGWQLWIRDSSTQTSPTSSSSESKDSAVHSADDTLSEQESLRQLLANLEQENAALRTRLNTNSIVAGSMVDLSDERVLQDAGIYRYHHPLENALTYRARLDELGERIALLVKGDQAIERSESFTLDGSLAKGRAMTSDLAKLMLRAYNAEAENVVRSLRAGNTSAAIKRLVNSKESIVKLGKMMKMQISEQFHALRIEEIELTADYLMKKEEEREAARAERERLREERKVELELIAAKEKLEKERSHIVAVIERVKEAGSSDAALESKLAEIEKAIELNDYRAANIRAGYVYIISNRGAFGAHVIKIGLTRRLEPLERIFELGDASVPFRFDVHAIFFSEDAVSLETELHERFSEFRMNWANHRKEFFFVSPSDVKTVLAEKLGKLLEFNEHVESEEYLQSVRYWPVHLRK